MSEFHFEKSFRLCFISFVHKRLDNSCSCSPGNVKSGNRISVTCSTTIPPLCPANDRKKLDSKVFYILIFFMGCKSQISFRPLTRPMVFGPVKSSRSHPVLIGKLIAVSDAHQALLWRVYYKQSTKGTKCLTTKILFGLLIKEEDFFSTFRDFHRRRQSGNTASDDDSVRSKFRFH